MKSFSHKKTYNSSMAQMHVEPPPTPLIKNRHGNKSDKYSVKINISRDPKSYTSDCFDFNMALFDNGEPEEFLLFRRNFDMNLAAPGTLVTGAKIQYLFTLVHGEALRQFH